MTSGSDRSFGGLLISLVLSSASAFGAEADWGLDALMASLHEVKSATAHFRERRYSTALTGPLETAGTLRFVAPDHLEKATLGLPPDRMVVEGKTLSGTRSDGERYEIALDDHPEIASLVEAVRSTLAGDLPTLRRYYDLQLIGSRGAWGLRMTPKDAAIRDKVALIEIDGRDATPTKIEVLEADGDRSEMIVTPDRP